MTIAELERLPLKSMPETHRRDSDSKTSVKFSIGWVIQPEVMDLSAYPALVGAMRQMRGQISVTIRAEAPVDARGTIDLLGMGVVFDIGDAAKRAGVPLLGKSGIVPVSPTCNHMAFIAGFAGALETLVRHSSGERGRGGAGEAAAKKKLAEAAAEVRSLCGPGEDARARFIVLALGAWGE